MKRIDCKLANGQRSLESASFQDAAGIYHMNTAEVVERNDYYPFGARWENPSSPVSDNRYLYNGKEKQTTGDLSYLDYGARMYNPILGRWLTGDPHAENYYSWKTQLNFFCVENKQITRIFL